jgi:hypothetical protein
MSGIVRVSRSVHPLSAIYPERSGIANGVTASAVPLRQIADDTTHALSKRLKVHFAWWSDMGGISNDTPVRMLACLSPNVWGYGAIPDGFARSLLRARVILGAVPGDAATNPDPLVKISTTDRTAGPSASINVEVKNSHYAATVGADNRHYIDIDLYVPEEARRRTYEIAMHFEDRCEPIAVCVYEVPPRALVVADGDVLPAQDSFFIGARVYDGPMADLYAAMDAVYDAQGTVFFAWSAMYTSEQPVVASATLTNPWDGNTDWAAGAFGFWAWPLFQGTLGSLSFGVVVWVIIKPDWTGTNQVAAAAKFMTGLGPVIGPIGEIDVQNYGIGPLSEDEISIALQTTWNTAGGLDDIKVDVLIAALVGTDVTLLGCGMYAKEPLDPRSIDGLAVWLWADQNASADLSAVAQWNDLSGNGNHAVQATGAAQPQYQAGLLSGRGAMVFAAGDWMSIPDSATYKAGELTVFVVARCTGTATAMTLVGYPHAATHTSPFWRWAITFASTNSVTVYTNGTAESFTSDFSTKKLTRVYTLHVANSGPAERQIRRDGGLWWEDFSADAITYPNAVGLRVGGDAVGGNNWVGEIFEVLIYDRKLTQDERERVDEMLSERHGLQRGNR